MLIKKKLISVFPCPCVRAVLSPSLSFSLYGWLCVCVCFSVLVFVLCRLTLSCLFAQHLKGQRQANNQPGASQVLCSPLSQAHHLGLPHIYKCIYIYKYISYIYLRMCVCNPNATWAKDGDSLPLELVSFASVSFSFFFFWYSCQGYGCFGTISCSLYIYNRYKNHKQWWQRVVKHTENWQWK